MQIEISAASFREKNILQNLMQYYLYEFSEIAGLEIDDRGLFSDQYLDHYWNEPDRYPYLVRSQEKLAGFALLRRGTYFPHQLDRDQAGMIVAEFFVMKRDRRQGVGTQVALDLFSRFPGRWEIAQEPNNQIGQAFWRTLISEYCGGEYSEYILDNASWCGPVQVFDNSTLLK